MSSSTASKSSASQVDHRHALRDVQTAARVQPKKLIKPVVTRWNSFYRAIERMVELRAHVSAVMADEQPSTSQWEYMNRALRVLEPFVTATDVLQADNATLLTVCEQMFKVHKHLLTLQQIPGFITFGGSALDALDSRWVKNFCNDAVIILQLLDPEQRLGSLDADQVKAARTQLGKYAWQAFSVPESVIEQELGSDAAGRCSVRHSSGYSFLRFLATCSTNSSQYGKGSVASGSDQSY